eukprot:SAG31_NODE_1722_length_7452_cov_2.771658_8_plen_120_part_00
MRRELYHAGPQQIADEIRVAASAASSCEGGLSRRVRWRRGPPGSTSAAAAARTSQRPTLLVLGHNPGLQEFLSRVVGHHTFPTAACALLEPVVLEQTVDDPLIVEWRLRRLIIPRRLVE